jgi:choline-sulfatase
MDKLKKKPNILFIMTDQQRFDYVGFMGADFVQTPNIDRIAERGMVFDYCCTNAPLCAPARISLATGLLPTRLGALDNEVFLPVNTTTYYQRLRDYGYQVGCVGKLDLAKPDINNHAKGNRPCIYSYGFTMPLECEGKEHAYSPTVIGPYTAYLEEKGLLDKMWETKEAHKKIKNHKVMTTKEHYALGVTDSILEAEDFEDVYIGRKAVEWINDIDNDYPWHLFVSFVGPHFPYDPPTSYADIYRNHKVPAPIKDDMTGKPDWIKQRSEKSVLTEEDILVTRRQYCAAIQLIDDQVGKILDTLEKQNMLEDTYIIISSDHGDKMGDHGLYSKRVAYEPSLRVPLVVAGPEIKAGTKSDALIELSDINPTICELAGMREQQEIDAESFCDVLFGLRDVHRENVVSSDMNFRCIRTHDYKCIINHNNITELYDMKNDKEELHNIAHEEPNIVSELSLTLKERYQEGKWLR